MRLTVASIAMISALAGCGQSRPGDLQRSLDNSEIVGRQSDRFQLVAAQGDYPPLLLDKATGCLVSVERDTDGLLHMNEISYMGGTSSCRLRLAFPVIEPKIGS